MKSLAIGTCSMIAVTLLSCGGSTVATDTKSRNQGGGETIACPSSKPLAHLIAESDLIVVASPNVPVARLQTAMLEDSPDYVDVRLQEVSFLKGAENASNLTVKVYPKKTTYAPSPETLLNQVDKRSLFFLTKVDEGPIGNYLTHSLEALQDASTQRVQLVRTEVRRQEVLVARFTPNEGLPHFNEVRLLLADLKRATPRQQEAIFRKLEALGPEGVPAMVALMDDRTRLADPRISLVNHSPDAFEGLRHYGPERVVDALDAILNQITGFGGSIVNGGSERERKNAIDAWRVYVADIDCA